ncbi:MAG: hypothetical protein NTY01_17445 [Verrucomicrobia bacterium]|nr:hypothetical protein [Verrucomicrobiota bacterium]
MKTISRNLLLLAMTRAVFLVICLCSACTGEYPVSREADLKKYPELAPFILPMKSFQGERCDVEAGVFKFAYVADFESPSACLSLFDQRATREGWRMIASGDCHRSYSKNLKRFTAQEKADIVIVSVDPAKSLVRVEWK